MRNFNYTYIKYSDFNKLDFCELIPEKLRSKIVKFLLFGEKFQKFNKEIENAFKILITKRNPYIAWKTGYEIWFECDRYYYLDYRYSDVVNNEIMK